MARAAGSSRPAAALALMSASGYAGLGYQIVWTQQCALWLGHETAAVLAVVGAFFAGSSAGAALLGARIERSARPARWYAACEATIGLWGLVLVGTMAPASLWLLGLIGPAPSAAWQWTVAFCGTFVLLLPATAAMGATLPALAGSMRTLAHRSTAALYAANTFGAVLGVLSAAFWLVPSYGLTRTAAVCIALNLACAAGAWRLDARRGSAPAPLPGAGRAAPAAAPLALLATTGLLGIGYEVLVVRVLSEVAENTVYTYALLLAVYLVGTALGSAAYQRYGTPAAPGRFDADESRRMRDRLLALLAVTCLLGTGCLWGAEALKAAVLETFGTGLGAALTAEAALAMAAFLTPTIAMGALFGHLATQAEAAGIGLGRALAANTLGAAVAPLLFGVVLLPLLGAKAALLVVTVGYLALSVGAARARTARWAIAGATLALAAWAPPLAFVDVPDGGRIVSYRVGATASVSVVEDADGVARLRIDNRQQEGTSATRLADARQALLPLLLHPAPRRALFLGLGTGVTAASAAEDQALQVDAVELLPEVVASSADFTRALNGGAPNPRLHVTTADARRYVRATTARYDVIVSDNFHPARSGSGALYTVEHFEAVRARLAPGGLFCQWLPLHQLDLATLRSIVRAFIAVYPDGWALLATNSLETPVLGLIAHADARRFDVQQVRERIATIALKERPAAFGLGDDFAVLGSFVAGPHALARFAGDAPLNTDDRPIVAYRAPRITYAPDSLPRDRLIELVHTLDVQPDEVLAAPADERWAARLAAYWRARNLFLAAGRDVQPSPDVRRMLAQVRDPLLAVLRESPDFSPAYVPLERMAAALARTDAPAARALLAELDRVRPRSALP